MLDINKTKIIIKEETDKLFFGEFGVETIKWEEMSDSLKTDILENIYHASPYLENNWNIWTFKEYLDDATDLPELNIEEKDTEDVYREMKEMGWGISERALSVLMDKLKRGINIDPILYNNGSFYDGGHRVLAHKNLGIEKIKTIDIGELLKINWEKWLTN